MKLINKIPWIAKFFILLTILASCVHSSLTESIKREFASRFGEPHYLVETQLQESSDIYEQKIQPIFNRRCIACHACFNAPCQLNLTSFAGLERGAIKDDIYNRREIGDKTPTRLGIDVPETFTWETVRDHWRKQRFTGSNGDESFFPVVSRHSSEPNERLQTSPLFQLINLKHVYSSNHDYNAQISHRYLSENTRQCPSQGITQKGTSKNVNDYLLQFDFGGMPFGFPELTDRESSDIYNWIQDGAPPPPDSLFMQMRQPSKPKTIADWENFFNEPGFKHEITARYIYEHLFLAHIYFEDMPGEFYRLIRAQCDPKLPTCHELPTRRPTDDPRTSKFFVKTNGGPVRYKFQKMTETLVHKTHTPFPLSAQKLARWQNLFIDLNKASESTPMPSYGNEAAGNPFLTFAAIPPASRYQFLLDDSYFFIMSFIKGPVCHGSAALSVIDDHFWVFFLKPSSDVTLQHPEFFTEAGENLAVPVTDGNDWTFFQIFKQRRRIARTIKKNYLNKYLPKGFAISDVWDGDGTKPNAVLTIYRHDDSATVAKGALGEAPKTMWMLDYPIFEDIYYNLVGTFDVYAPLVHALKSRLHMDASRFNGQDMYLSFMPPDVRKDLRQKWTRDKDSHRTTPTCSILPAELCAFYTQSANTMRDIVYPYASTDKTPQIQFSDPKQAHHELATRILNSLPSPVTMSTFDSIQNAHLNPPEIASMAINLYNIGNKLAEINGTPGIFASFLPELSFIQIVDPTTKQTKWFTLIHNRERYNVAFFDDIAPESTRLWPEKDTLNILPGFIGSYANAIFSVELNKVDDFTHRILALKNEGNLQQLYDLYLVSRHNKDFWKYWDDLLNQTKSVSSTVFADPYEGSSIDLNRYTNATGFERTEAK